VRGWNWAPARFGVHVVPLFKLVVLAWLVLGPLGLWLRRRNRRRT
jgi:hypothetical protein